MKKRHITICSVSILVFFSLAAEAFGYFRCPGPKPKQKRIAAQTAYESGMQFAQSGLYDQAAGKFEEAIRMCPNFHSAHMNLGVTLIQKGKDWHRAALRHLKAAEAAESRQRPQSRDPLVQYNLTVIHTLLEDFPAAYQALDKALSFRFKNFDALRADEDLYELRRKPEFRKVLERHNVFL